MWHKAGSRGGWRMLGAELKVPGTLPASPRPLLESLVLQSDYISATLGLVPLSISTRGAFQAFTEHHLSPYPRSFS